MWCTPPVAVENGIRANIIDFDSWAVCSKNSLCIFRKGKKTHALSITRKRHSGVVPDRCGRDLLLFGRRRRRHTITHGSE